MGSKWDSKIIGRGGKDIIDLRMKVGEAVVLKNQTYREIQEEYQVSHGFICKWSKIFREVWHIKQLADEMGIMFSLRSWFVSISNRPKNIKKQLTDEEIRGIIERKTKYPFEGACRIKHALDSPRSPTTITKVMRVNGLIGEPERRNLNVATTRYEKPMPNDLWHIDSKKWKFGSERFETSWIVDDRSRFILGFWVGRRLTPDDVVNMVDSASKTFGKPRRILTDNGFQFSGNYDIELGCGIDWWCLKEGVEHIHSKVKHPETNGKVERTHRSANEEISVFGPIENIEQAWRAFGEWIDYHNNESPHQALGYDYPVNVYLGAVTLVPQDELDELEKSWS